MSAGRVFVIGNVSLDLRIELPRLPLPGETLLGSNSTHAPGGKGLNQAVAAARTGVAVQFLAPLGRDGQGAGITAALVAEGFERLELPGIDAPTDYSILMVLPNGENSITGAGPCAAALKPADAAQFAAMATAGDIVVLQGNLSEAATGAALRAARGTGARTLFNPAPLWWDARSVLGLCDIVVANRGEALVLTGIEEPEAAALALQAVGVGVAIVTLGAEGCVVASDAVRRHAAPRVTALDTTGCGDAFCGVLAAMLVQGRALEDAIAVAQRAAALTATRAGAFPSLPSRAEMLSPAVSSPSGGRARTSG